MMTNLNKEESGRSMVEMLGVLAVIGVLSITGISGYTTAMNKHKANEILDAASKRAVAISTQIQRGKTDPTLGEFETNEVGGATFDDEVTVTGNRFQISFETGKQPSEEVWAQMQSITGSDGIVREFKETRIGLVYNNDLTTDAIASDYKDSTSCGTYATTGRTWCANVSKCAQGDDCCSVMTYDSQCQTCSGGTVGNKESTVTCNYNNGTGNGHCNGNGACIFSCGTGEKEVEYGGTKHCVKILGTESTYPEAYNACRGIGMSLMSKADLVAAMGTDCTENVSHFYECDINKLASKIGLDKNGYSLWLADCHSGCPTDLGDEDDTSGYSWHVYASMGVIDDYPARGMDSHTALCVR